MKWGDRLKDAVRSWLNVQPAGALKVNVYERFDFQANAYKNMLWYRGSAFELNQFYRQIPNETMSFWGSVPTEGRNIRKLHTGLPSIMVDTLANIITADMDDIDVQNEAKRLEWVAIADENKLKEVVRKAVQDVLVVGDGAFKISVDTDISDYPIIEWYAGNRVEFDTRRGRCAGITFKTEYKRGNVVYTLHEVYKAGSVEYKLFRGDTEVQLDAIPETADLERVEFDNSFIMAVPFMVSHSATFRGRGASIYDNKIDNFDALDECYSQWWQAMRDSRPTKYIPDSMIPREPETGAVIAPNAFDNQYIAIGSDMSERANNQVVLVQPAYNANEYTATYITALDNCVQGIISPSTLGIDVKKLDNAEAQREKEKATLYTRQRIIEALTPALQGVVNVVFKTIACMDGTAVEDTPADVNFGEYANPSFEAVIETLSNPNTPMSIEAKVEEMWGDSKDAAWKAQEVARIKEQTGVVSMDEPAMAMDIEALAGEDMQTETMAQAQAPQQAAASEEIKALNGAQTQSLIAIMGQFSAGALSEGQAVNLISTAIGIDKDAARKILNGEL